MAKKKKLKHEIVFDKARAKKVVDFLQLLVHVKGPKAGQNFKLEKWQKDLVSKLYGTIWADTGLRVYRQCIIFLPRKNGKSFLASGLVLYHLIADGEGGAEVYTAASTFLQASLIFDSAAEMVKKNPLLSKRITVNSGRKNMYVNGSNSIYRALTASADSLMGLNPSLVVVDELHTINDAEYIDTLKTSLGARSQPLFLTISTAGYDSNSVGKHYFDYAQSILAGDIDDPTVLPVIYAADPNDDWTSEDVWAKANPNLGVSIDISYLRSECKRAMQDPSYINSFKTLYLNQWTNSSQAWLKPSDIDACFTLEQITDDELIHEPCCIGLDLSSTTDLTSLSLYFPTKQVVKNVSFLPSDITKEKEQYDSANYSAWADQGFVIKTPGNIIDYRYIRSYINDLRDKYDIKLISYDPWNATQLAIQLEQEDGCTVYPVRQGYQSLSKPTKELESLIIGHKLNFCSNSCFRYALNNVSIQRDVNDNIRPIKGKDSRRRIDPVVSLIIAIAGWELSGISTQQQESIYETGGLMFI